MKPRSRRPARHGGATPDDGTVHDLAREPRGCAAPEDFPRLMDMACDREEALAISLIRFVMAGYCSGRADDWDLGFQFASDILGDEGGTIFFTRIMALGRALKSERCGTFHFMAGQCSRICEDELELLAALQAARRSDPALLEEALHVLARQPRALRLRAAVLGLAGLVEALAASETQHARGTQHCPDTPPRILH